MISHIQEFVIDKAQALNDQVTRIRQGSVKSARVAVQGSAESLKGLKNPVRLVARSGVRLSTVSQTAVQELIELQSEALTAAITEFAQRLERAARAASVSELVRDQVEMLPATRARMAGDAGRVLQIVTSTGREIRDLATETLRTRDGSGREAGSGTQPPSEGEEGHAPQRDAVPEGCGLRPTDRQARSTVLPLIAPSSEGAFFCPQTGRRGTRGVSL